MTELTSLINKVCITILWRISSDNRSKNAQHTVFNMQYVILRRLHDTRASAFS